MEAKSIVLLATNGDKFWNRVSVLSS